MQKSKINPPAGGQKYNSRIKRYRKIVIFTFCTVILHFALCTLNLDTAEASAVSLGVYPPLTEIEAQAPATIAQPILIHNLGQDPISLLVQIRPFVASLAENGQITYAPDKKIIGVNSRFLDYVSIWENGQRLQEITLAPGEEKTVTLHIEILAKESPSDYYFSILFISKNDQNISNNLLDENVTYLQGGIAINVLLTIGPKGQSKGKLEEFSSPPFVQSGPVPFIARVSNTGDHLVKASGNILVKNMFNQTVGNIEIQPTNVLAKSVRRLQNNDSGTIEWKESFLIGRYKATIVLSYANQGPIFTKTITFYAFPYTLFIGILLATLIVIAIKKKVYRRLHWYKSS